MRSSNIRRAAALAAASTRRLKPALYVLMIVVASFSVATAAENPLLDAAERGDRAAVMRLLTSKGVNVNTPGPDGTTAIMYAAANDDLELVRALIKAGADAKAKNQFGTTAITEAAIPTRPGPTAPRPSCMRRPTTTSSWCAR